MKALLIAAALTVAATTPAAAQGFSTMMAGQPQPTDGNLAITSGPANVNPSPGPYTSSPWNAVLPTPIGRGVSQQHPRTNMPVVAGPGPGQNQAAPAPGFRGGQWGYLGAGRSGGQQASAPQQTRPANPQRSAPSYAFRGVR